VVEIHAMVIIVYMLINLGEGVLVPNRCFVLINPNFSLFFSFTYIYRVAIITIYLIYNICFVS